MLRANESRWLDTEDSGNTGGDERPNQAGRVGTRNRGNGTGSRDSSGLGVLVRVSFWYFTSHWQSVVEAVMNQPEKKAKPRERGQKYAYLLR